MVSISKYYVYICRYFGDTYVTFDHDKSSWLRPKVLSEESYGYCLQRRKKT